MSLSFLNTNSFVGIILMVGFMLVSATIGIAIMAAVFSALMQFVFDRGGDRDAELLAAAAGDEADADA
ncbi:MAG: hypothetical protein K1X95_07775 [Acidimicrobiia bacterium]|nr:hypothetical protein [Acidimicrobiia bacterium]